MTPNTTPHRDGREASHFGQQSRAPARERERYAPGAHAYVR